LAKNNVAARKTSVKIIHHSNSSSVVSLSALAHTHGNERSICKNRSHNKKPVPVRAMGSKHQYNGYERDKPQRHSRQRLVFSYSLLNCCKQTKPQFSSPSVFSQLRGNAEQQKSRLNFVFLRDEKPCGDPQYQIDRCQKTENGQIPGIFARPADKTINHHSQREKLKGHHIEKYLQINSMSNEPCPRFLGQNIPLNRCLSPAPYTIISMVGKQHERVLSCQFQI